MIVEKCEWRQKALLHGTSPIRAQPNDSIHICSVCECNNCIRIEFNFVLNCRWARDTLLSFHEFLPYFCMSLANGISSLATGTAVLRPCRWVDFPWCHRQMFPKTPNTEWARTSSSTQRPPSPANLRGTLNGHPIGWCRMESTIAMMCYQSRCLSMYRPFGASSCSSTGGNWNEMMRLAFQVTIGASH